MLKFRTMVDGAEAQLDAMRALPTPIACCSSSPTTPG